VRLVDDDQPGRPVETGQEPVAEARIVEPVILADTASSETLHDRHRLWPHIQGWAAELGLTAPDALDRISQPSGDISADRHDPSPRLPDNEPGPQYAVTNSNARTGPPIDFSVYERLIDNGIADADQRRGAIDHITGRRLAIWLTARPQQPAFTQALAHFTRTGAFNRDLVVELSARARSANSPNRSEAQRLLHSTPDRTAWRLCV
jgi:hypothetical protein